MKTLPLSRRKFVGTCAAATAVCAYGGTTAFASVKNKSAEADIGVAARPEHSTAPGICTACAQGCGFTAYVVDGKLDKVIGNGLDPNSAGTLCARGFGYTNSAADAGTLKAPKVRGKNGELEATSWGTALKTIGDKLKNIIDVNGPGAVALIYNGASSTAAAYAPRFMRALGSGNTFVNDVVLNVTKAAAFEQTIGVSAYAADIEGADVVLLIDTSYADIATPSLSKSLASAKTNGAKIVAIDSRLGGVAQVADTWIDVNPGTELALLLAVCNSLTTSGKYDKNFVAENANGFDEWKSRISSYTTSWAEDITGVDAYRIDELVSTIAAASPRVAIQFGNGDVGAATFANTTETARTVCLLNMLLGTWGQPGGALMPFDFSDASLDAAVGAARAGKGMLGATRLAFSQARADFPLAAEFGASTATTLLAANKGNIKALFAVENNIAYDYASVPDLAEKLDALDLVVCITNQMNETALASDVVLPVANYLATDTLPKFTSGKVASVSIARAAVEPAENALDLATIFEKLAAATGVDSAFNFTQTEAAEAQLGVLGLTLDGLYCSRHGTAYTRTNEARRRLENQKWQN